MNIAKKITMSSILLVSISTVVVGFVIGHVANELGINSFTQQLEGQLKQTEVSKRLEIKHYLDNIKNQVLTSSSSQFVVNAMDEFSQAYGQFRVVQEMVPSIRSYYSNEFGVVYKEKNNNQSVNIDSLINKLDAESQYLQYHYISNNRNPLGSKEQLDYASDGSRYSQVHQKYHVDFRDFLSAFGYYDIFLVDINSGDIVYSVFKELDYTTSLKDGPFADTGIGRAFRGAEKLNNKDEFYFEDFDEYTPSYEAGASFISSPIFKNGEKIGVIIFQMPVEKINSIMTFEGNWKDSGMGQYSEALLVDSRKYIINEHRGYVEYQKDYYNALTEKGTELPNMIKARESSIGIYGDNSEAVHLGMSGQQGFLTQNNYMGRETLVSYAPIDFGGIRWVSLSLIDKEEAFRGLEVMSESIYKAVFLTSMLVIVAGLFASKLLSSTLVKPINVITQRMKEISEGDGDLTYRLPETGQDEISSLSINFNQFVEKVQAMVLEIHESITMLRSNAKEMKDIGSETVANISDQSSQSSTIEGSIIKMTERINEVARNADSVVQAAESSAKEAVNANTIFSNTLSDINHTTEQMTATASVVNTLEKGTRDIGGVLDVIRGIAEQTNLLALNAAIEAARAGEQGRGFAVVADEVRTLASRTQDSTQEIEVMINDLQHKSAEAVSMMSASIDRSKSSVGKGQEAGTSVESTSNAIVAIHESMVDVAASTDEQSKVTEEMHKSISGISGLTEKVDQQIGDLDELISQLVQISSTLENNANRFKVS